MVTILSTTILISNAATTKQYKTIGYSRLGILGLIPVIFIIYDNTYMRCLENGMGLYNGLFNVNTLTQYFNVFIILIASIILFLTGVYPRKIYNIFNSDSSKYTNNIMSSLGLSDSTNIVANTENTKFSAPQVSNNIQSEKTSYNEEKKLSIKLLEFFLNKSSNQFSIIEYTLVITFIILGAAFLMSTGDLVSLFLSIELQSYGLYILATLYRDSESATGSGLTYFLLGGLSSCFILFGSAILYINSGSTNLDNLYIINSISEYLLNDTSNINNVINNTFYYSNYINLALVVLSVGFLFKVSAAPFHFWSPDVYDGITTHVTTFVAIIAKISLFVILLELVSYTNFDSILESTFNTSLQTTHEDNFINTHTDWKNILILSSMMSLIIGSVLGITQYRIKRLLAYSTISHVGFILLALSINKTESIQGYIFYILQYSISNLNVFFILILIGYSLYGYISKFNHKFIDKENSPIQLLEQIRGYFYVNSYLTISFAITLFSFIGIPPLIGFFAKQMVLSAALDGGYVFITLIAVITSVIGAAYYLNLVKLIFFSSNDNTNTILLNNEDKSLIKYYYYNTHISNYLSIIVSVLTMVIILFIFTPEEWYKVTSIVSIASSKL